MIKVSIKIICTLIYLGLLLSYYKDEPYLEYKINKSYSAYKIEENIIVDGVLDDPIWNFLSPISGLRQAEPIYNANPSENTDIKICYNEEYIYIGVLLYNESGQISYKDGSNDDFIGVFDLKSDYFIIEFDTYHDHQTGYGFAVNSSGIKSDYMLYSDEYIDDNWDTQWDAHVTSFDNGWSIEYKIPFKNLRLNVGKNLTWGMNIVRYIKHYNEYISWVIVPLDRSGIVSKYGHLNDLDIAHKKTTIFNSYMLRGNFLFDDIYYPIYYDSDVKEIELSQNSEKYYKKFISNDFGFNLKHAFSSNSSFDFTYNPDFEQINQDPSEVNNTPYETLFDDKRNFFLEDALFFNTPIKVFYSRRIGGNIKYNDEYNFLSSFQTKLNYASKYAFKNNKFNYGFLIAKSDPINTRQNNQSYNIQSSIFRLSHLFINNQSKVGFIGTDYKANTNNVKVYGIDYSLSLLNNKLFLDGQSIQSVDNNKKGFGETVEIGYRTDVFSIINKELYIDTWYSNSSYDKKLDINDLGYLFRNNLKEKIIGLAINNDKELIKSKYVFQHYFAKSFSGDILSDIFSFNYDIQFKNYSYLNIGLSKENEHYKDKFYDDYFSLDLNKIVKSPNSKTFNIIYGNDILKYIEYSFSYKQFKNDINDKGKEYFANIIIKPKRWLELDFSYDLLTYYETYHFLKIRENPIVIDDDTGNSNSEYFGYNNFTNNIRLENDSFKYIFTNSNNKEIIYTSKLSAYVNNITLQLYTEYFVHEDVWINESNQYFVDENFINYNYPTINNDVEQLVGKDDKLLYNALYSSGVVNFSFKWSFSNNSNLYILYSINKIINGRKMNSLKDLLNIDKENLNSDPISELLYDRSLFLKCELYFNP